MRCVDLLAGDLVDMYDDATITRTHISEVAAVVRPRSAGGAVVPVERGILLLDAAGNATGQPEIWSDPGVRMNDGGCDPDGRFYCGSMAYDETPGRGSLYRLDKDGTAKVILTGVTISNGFAFAPDRSRRDRNSTSSDRAVIAPYRYAQPLRHRPSVGQDSGSAPRRKVAGRQPTLSRPDGAQQDAANAHAR